MLPKGNHTWKTKCPSVFLWVSMTLRHSNPSSTQDFFLGKTEFVFKMKAQITQNEINQPKLCFVNHVRAGNRSSLQYEP